MKKKLLLFVLISFIAAGSLQAQIRKIPSEVTEALKAKFPNAEKIEWKDKVSYFEADFVSDSVEITAAFSGKGEWKETDTKMSFDQLPSEVKVGFSKSKYSDWTPGSVTKIDKKGKSIRYRIYAEKSSLVQKKVLYFNEEGQLKNQEQAF